MAISPKEVLVRVKNRIQMLAKERSERLDKLANSDILQELQLLYQQGIEPMQPTDFSGAFKGRHNIYDHLSLLIKEAEKSIALMTTEEGLIRKMRILKPLLEKAKARGVDIKIIAPITPKTKEIVEKIKNIAEIRNVKDIKARFCVVDGKQLMFMLMDDKEVHPTYDIGLWVNTPFFAGAMKKMFDKIWETGSSEITPSELPPEKEPSTEIGTPPEDLEYVE